jgi:dihydroflavonol-4-reductase
LVRCPAAQSSCVCLQLIKHLSNTQMSVNGTRVFITGATGFVGGALATALAQQGAEIHALTRPGADRCSLKDLAITWHEGDITNPASLNGALAHADCIIHAAGKLGQAGVPEQVYRQVHVDGTRNIMTAALASRSRPLVLHVSSPGVLGPVAGTPANEDAPYRPTNSYERTKASAERVAREFAAQGLRVVIARPEFIYGPGDRHVLRLFHSVRQRRFLYIDSGRHLCHPTFIEDAVRGMLLCLDHGKPGQVYHIAGPRPITFRELGATIAASLGVRPPVLTVPRGFARVGVFGLEAVSRVIGRTPPLTRTGLAFFSEDRQFSWKKANAELGYVPQFDFAKGTACTVAWYRKHQWL